MYGMTLVTVKPNQTMTVHVNGWNFVYVGGDTLYVPNFEVAYLRQSGVIV